MAMPSFLRDLSPRIKSLGAPIVWAPLTIVGLLGAFAWEYSRNPDWFNQEQSTNLNPNFDLTDEEQARLSEIDTIELLLEQSQASEGTRPSISIISPDVSDQPATTTEITPSPNSRQLSGRDDPFAPYAADYEFPGAKASASNSASLYDSNASRSINNSENFSFGNGPATPAAPVTNSALSQALDRQQSARNTAASQQNNPQPTVSTDALVNSLPATTLEGRQSSSSADIPSSAQPVGQTGSQPIGQSVGQPIGQSGLQPAPASGNISVPYIRTTPDMSPPVGTTGYQAPATIELPVFNVAPQQPSRNPFSAAPTTPSAPTTPQSDTLYTAPTSIQPTQPRQRR